VQGPEFNPQYEKKEGREGGRKEGGKREALEVLTQLLGIKRKRTKHQGT
jgi:hypothetical protein